MYLEVEMEVLVLVNLIFLATVYLVILQVVVAVVVRQLEVVDLVEVEELVHLVVLMELPAPLTPVVAVVEILHLLVPREMVAQVSSSPVFAQLRVVVKHNSRFYMVIQGMVYDFQLR